MVYKETFVAALKTGGKVLRENNNEVILPYGAEYSLLLKNLNSVKSMVQVFIDGDNVTDGWLILGPNQNLELERYIRNGNLEKGNRFKFIEKTASIENHRCNKVDDGLIRVEYKFEKRVFEQPEVHRYPVYEPYYVPRPWYYPYWSWPYPLNEQTITWTSSCQTDTLGGAQCGISGTACTANSGLSNAQNSAAQNMCYAMNAGITVPGSESDQKFTTTSSFRTEDQSHVIVLKLKGTVKGVDVEEPLLVQTKLECATCGKSNKSSARFCPACGTSLVII